MVPTHEPTVLEIEHPVGAGEGDHIVGGEDTGRSGAAEVPRGEAAPAPAPGALVVRVGAAALAGRAA